MAPFEARVTPSLLDRLTDDAPASSSEAPRTRSQSLSDLKDSLKRDLTALLNTKRCEEEVPDEFAEASHSLLTYGLPDFSSYSLKSPTDQSRLRRAIEFAIRRFEPRLEKVTVTLEPFTDTDGAFHFRVDGFLRVHPAPEPVSFETRLLPDSGHFVVGARR